jgi:hypothetical protein
LLIETKISTRMKYPMCWHSPQAEAKLGLERLSKNSITIRIQMEAIITRRLNSENNRSCLSSKPDSKTL